MSVYMITDILFDSVKQYKDRIAVETNNSSFSYREVLFNSMAVYNRIQELNLPISSKISIVIGNEPAFLFYMFGILLSGHIMVPIPTNITEKEITKILKSSDTVVCFHSEVIKKTLLENVIFIPYNLPFNGAEKLVNLNPLSISEQDIAFLLPTSGSTGNSKLVMLTHKNIKHNAEAHGERVGFSSNDTFMVTMPIYFSSVITTQIISALIFGVKIFLPELPLLPRGLMTSIETRNVSGLSAVPTVLYQLVEGLSSQKKVISRLKYMVVSGASLSEKLHNSTLSVFPNTDIIQSYGLTEASPRVSLMQRGEKELSCGTPVKGVTVMINSKDGRSLSAHEIGEIWVSGPNIMKGYYKNEELTSETIINGWLKTGDLGYLDNNGRIFITGRLKNVINIGGNIVHPEEIEMVLTNYKGIKEVLVTLKTDVVYGEVPIVFIVLEDGISVNIADIRSYCRSYLASYKIPNEFVIIDALPKTGTGKIKRVSVDYFFDK